MADAADSAEGEFADDVAVVTGGTKGIGRATVERLAREGATVVATYHSDEEAAGDLADWLGRRDVDGRVRKFDVGDHGAVRAGFDAITDVLGPPTVLVNNAGVMRNGLLIRMDPDDWQQVLETNLTGAFYCTRAAARRMLRAGGGRIVNVSSVAARRGWPGQANYAASKAGLIGLTRAVARELGGRSIRVNAVCPGYAGTELYDRLADGREPEIEAEIPQGRVADPAEIAEAIAFLASPRATYVNGAVLTADGGLLA